MRALVLALILSFSTFAEASQTQFSDLTQKQQDNILTALQSFLPTYRNALEIALHNIERQSVGTMDVNVQMSDMVLADGTAVTMFEKVAAIFGNQVSMDGFEQMRGSQSYTQARKEMAQTESLSFHVCHNHHWNDKAWMKHMNSQVEVVLADENSATVRLLNFPRAHCVITADSATVVHQHCN